MLIQDYDSWLYVQCSLTELLKAFLVKTQHNAFEDSWELTWVRKLNLSKKQCYGIKPPWQMLIYKLMESKNSHFVTDKHYSGN